MKARIYKSTGSWYSVKSEEGLFYQARIKGVIKLDAISSTNPIAVGDWVQYDMEDADKKSVMITDILDRDNYVARQSPHNKRQQHIIASNLDQSILLATLKSPKTSQGFIDRFLVSCEAFHIPAMIVFNKSDIYGPTEMAIYDMLKSMYEAVGYQVFLISINQKEGLEAIEKVLLGKTTLISGHSGVGKSSFINYLFPNLDLSTQEVSGWSGKGMHTTTFAQMYDLPNGGAVIDTPGMRELGLVNLEKEELAQYFPEMREKMQGCQFHNCQHINEPGCSVKAAVEKGIITEARFFSYVDLWHGIEPKKY
ncbi:MAG: ribosome small subunit-dependent GTPase A [Bacteroidetes bacterium]|nr:ribosome small subunit-dependent GTPase A [Bacteroidota bacterium]